MRIVIAQLKHDIQTPQLISTAPSAKLDKRKLSSKVLHKTCIDFYVNFMQGF